MSCETPENCQPCQDCPEPAQPVLPKCQDIDLPAGVYTNATVTVNADGCIVKIETGEPPLYTPDPCCAPLITGGGGGSGLQGPPGDAATIEIGEIRVCPYDENAQAGTDPTQNCPAVWNTGTDQAAVLNFKLMRGPQGDTGATPQPGDPNAVSDNICGLVVQNGLIMEEPASPWRPVMDVLTMLNGQALNPNFTATRNPDCSVTVNYNEQQAINTANSHADSNDAALRVETQAWFDYFVAWLGCMQATIDNLKAKTDALCAGTPCPTNPPAPSGPPCTNAPLPPEVG